MSKKGQDNQKGISFQNKVALLYLLKYYRFRNFLEIKLEGENWSDFTVFFHSSSDNSRFFYNFEVKNQKKPLTTNDVKKILQKEVSERGINYYSANRDKFYIVASKFSRECIDKFKDKYLFLSNKVFDSQKNLYKKVYGDHELLEWSKKEIFMVKNTEFVELNEDKLNNQILDNLFFEHSFYYTKGDTENLINRFLGKITNASSQGLALTKQKIKYTLEEFHNQETDKSESYNLNTDLGTVIHNLDQKLETEQGFETLNQNRFITPLSQRPRAINYIADKLKERQFNFKKITWFIDKILIKEAYLYTCFQLLEIYLEKNKSMDFEDISSILDIISQIYEYSAREQSSYSSIWNDDNYIRIIKLFFQIEKTNPPNKIKQKIIDFLDQAIPPWDNIERFFIEYGYKYESIPILIEKLLGITKEGISFIFKKYNFIRNKEDYWLKQQHPKDYIESFINKNFESHFRIVVDHLSKQFQNLYQKRYDIKYEGYEITGGYSGSNDRYSLKYFSWEPLLARCINKFYEQNPDKNWKILKLYVSTECDQRNPVFVKRAFIPFLLGQLTKTSQKPKNKNLYQALESILKIKRGFPSTDEAAVHELYTKNLNLPDSYLEKILHTVLHKYSDEGITGSILIIQFIIDLISKGKHQFKHDLKRILMNKKIKQSYIYERILRILEKHITNTHIKSFIDEIKSKIDMSKNPDLRYHTILNLKSDALKKHPLFKSIKKEDLDHLANIIQKAFFENKHDFLKEVLKFLDNNLESFYEKINQSVLLKQVIAQSAQYVTKDQMQLKEKIIEQCLQDTELCGENQEQQKEIMKETAALGRSTMRAELCHSIDNYIHNNLDNPKELEKAFFWVKILMDLNSSLANKITGFPKPNYYLRWFASIPLISLSYYQTRKTLNKYKPGLGDEVKKFAFQLLNQTTKEVEKYKRTPNELFNQIGNIFNVIRDLNTQDAKTVLDFIKTFNVAEYSYLFIYYALLRDKEPIISSEIPFDSKFFKKILKNICCENSSNTLKEKLSFTIYKWIKSEDKNIPPDFDFFNKIEPYWISLLKNTNPSMYLFLIGVLSIVLSKNSDFYEKYKKYLFTLIKDMIKTALKSGDYFTHSQQTFLVVAEKNPDDLITILLLILEKGDTARGIFPLSYEVREDLIPIIKDNKKKISPQKIQKAENELKKYNLKLD